MAQKPVADLGGRWRQKEKDEDQRGQGKDLERVLVDRRGICEAERRRGTEQVKDMTLAISMLTLIRT